MSGSVPYAAVGMALPPASSADIGGKIDATDIVALRTKGPYKGMVLVNNPGDSDFISAFTLGELQPTWLNPMVVESTITGLSVEVAVSDPGAPVMIGQRVRFRWDDGTPDSDTSIGNGVANHTYANAGTYLVRVTNDNGQIAHHSVTVA